MLAQALSHTLATGMGSMMKADDRAAWQVAMIADMQDIPADLALEALTQARRRCTRAAEILPFVVDYVEDYPARRRARLRQLIELADVVGIPVA